jgi:hypothetical protein
LRGLIREEERDHLPYEGLDDGKGKYGHYLANDLKVPVCCLCHLAAGCWLMMDPTMNEHGSQGQSAAGSELLLGMHGFVGGQSQNSGRAPGPATCSFCVPRLEAYRR